MAKFVAVTAAVAAADVYTGEQCQVRLAPREYTSMGLENGDEKHALTLVQLVCPENKDFVLAGKVCR